MFTTQQQQRQLDELKRLCEEWGGLMSPGGAANACGVSRQAVNGWMLRDSVRHARFRDLGVFVSVEDVRARKNGVTKKVGRPPKASYSDTK
jgi:hypothetical protein